jgi:hypothetical protein
MAAWTPPESDRQARWRRKMAKKKRGYGLLGTFAIIVIILLIVAYLQQHHFAIHLPKIGN